jgi:hypothetical protein
MSGATVAVRVVPPSVRFPRRRSEPLPDTLIDRRRKETDGVKSARERAEEKRAEKLELVQEQVESGSLVIRKMTDEERRRYPPVPPRPKRLDRR